MIQKTKKICHLLVNFGGPRSLHEVEGFLISLLTDKDVVRTKFPQWAHNLLFTKIAKKRSVKVSEDYTQIGGKSPIHADTEALADQLRTKLADPIFTFHRYLPETHHGFIEQICRAEWDEIRVFPLFPQFTYATTGSIARWFTKHLPAPIVCKMRWIKSYSGHPAFIHAHQNAIKEFLQVNQLDEKNVILLFSSHGVPRLFEEQGDPYQGECEISFRKIMQSFPNVVGRLSFQSKFGKGEWLRPYTIDVCEEINQWSKGRQHVVFVPLSFTSDHIETLFEVEQEYLPVIRKNGLQAHRVPALTLRPDWIDAIVEIMKETNLCNTQMLVRRGRCPLRIFKT